MNTKRYIASQVNDKKIQIKLWHTRVFPPTPVSPAHPDYLPGSTPNSKRAAASLKTPMRPPAAQSRFFLKISLEEIEEIFGLMEEIFLKKDAEDFF